MSSSEYETVTLRKEVLSRLGVFYHDMKRGDGFANLHWIGMGHVFTDSRGDGWLAYIHPSDQDHARETVERHYRGDTPHVRMEYRVRAADGTYRWFISSGLVERRDANGRPLTYVGHDEDVTDLHRLREELQDAHQLAEERAAEAEALCAAGAVVVSSLDAPTAVRSVAQQLQTLVPFESAFVCEIEDRELKLVGGSDDITAQMWHAFVKRNLRRFLKIITSRIPDVLADDEDAELRALLVPLVVRGSTLGVLTALRRAASFSGEEIRIAMAMADFLGLALSNARLYKRMQQRAEIDQLSGVLTRRAFMESGEQIIDHAFHAGKPLCCIMLDLDHFKSINDTFGHPVGDQVIRTLGGILRDSLRSTDTIGRFGGEEFCAILSDTSIKDGVDVAGRLRTAIGAMEFPGVDHPVTASIGITGLANCQGEDANARERLSIEQTIKRADDALYSAKTSGRNKVVSYTTDMAT